MEKRLIANSMVILREELDGWAILFDPDTSNAFSISGMGVEIWKLLGGKYTKTDIVKKLKEEYKNSPKDAGLQVGDFIKELIKNGLVGYEKIG